MNEEEVNDLAVAAAAGDLDATSALIRLLLPYLFDKVTWYCTDKQLWEDFRQECVLAIYDVIKTQQPPFTLVAFRRAANNLCQKITRRRRKEVLGVGARTPEETIRPKPRPGPPTLRECLNCGTSVRDRNFCTKCSERLRLARRKYANPVCPQCVCILMARGCPQCGYNPTPT